MSSSLLKKIPQALIQQSLRCIATTNPKAGFIKVQDDQDFLERVEKSKGPVIVDFFAK